jgi:hypothetical protein
MIFRFYLLPEIEITSSLYEIRFIFEKEPIFVYFVWSHRLRRHAFPSGLPSSARPYPKERSQQYLRPSLPFVTYDASTLATVVGFDADVTSSIERIKQRACAPNTNHL